MRQVLHFLLLLFSGYAILHTISETVLPIYGDSRAHVQAIGKREHIPVLGMGNSHMSAFDPAQLHPDATKIGIGYADLNEYEAMLNWMHKKGVRIDTLILLLSPYHFSLDKGYSEEDDLRQLRFEVIWMLPGSPIFPKGLDEWAASWFLPVARPDRWKPILFDRGLAKIPGLITLMPLPEHAQFSEERFIEHAEGRYQEFEDRARLILSKYPELPETQEATLKRILATLKTRGTVTITVTTPFYHVFPDKFDQPIWSGFPERVKRITAEAGVPYWEHRLDPAFIFQPEFFRDSDHMNKIGAVAFSKLLRQRLDTLRRVTSTLQN
jgi:hypothetical protein